MAKHNRRRLRKVRRSPFLQGFGTEHLSQEERKMMGLGALSAGSVIGTLITGVVALTAGFFIGRAVYRRS